MPYQADNEIQDRHEATDKVNVHPTIRGGVILSPTDVLEGRGNFGVFEEDGDPEGWELGQPAKGDGREIYVGLRSDTTALQTHTTVAYDRPSHLINYTLQDGPPPPDESTPGLADLPRAVKPILKKVAVERLGFDASTPISPYWYAWAYYRGGKLTLACPPVPFELENGQSVRVPLPQDLPDNIFEVALLVSEPGTSRPTGPGPMRVQRVVDLRTYNLDTYDLGGPYRDTGALAPATNETVLPNAPTIYVERVASAMAARVGNYVARVTWTDENGETLAVNNSFTNVTIGLDKRFTLRDQNGLVAFPAGRGQVRVHRPAYIPPHATGWRCYVYLYPTQDDLGYAAGWYVVTGRLSGYGDAVPLPLWMGSVTTAGWFGDEQHYGSNDDWVLKSTLLPEKNTTGLPNPTDQPETPEVYGFARPDAGTYHVRAVDLHRGRRSLPSEAASITISDSEYIQVELASPVNEVPNATFTETDSRRLPLSWDVDKTGGDAKVVGKELHMETAGAVTTATPTAATSVMEIDPAKDAANLLADFSLDAPPAGTLQGNAQMVLREFDAAGAFTDRPLFTAAAIGEHDFRAKVFPTGTANQTTWLATTKRARLIYGFSGAAKNARMRVRETVLRKTDPGPRTPRRRKKPPTVKRPNTAPFKTQAQDPPEPAWSPDGFPVRHPDRPKEPGLLRELLSFDAGLPTGLTTVQTGGGAVSVSATAAIAGAQGLLCKKAAGGQISSAFAEKAYPSQSPFPNLHHLGSYAQNRMPVFPQNGHAYFHPLNRPLDKAPFAWLEASTFAEINDVTLTEGPLLPGNVSVTLDGVRQNYAVNSTKEVAELTLNGGTQGPGMVAVVLGGIQHLVQTGGTKQVVQMHIRSAPQTAGVITVGVGGINQLFYVTPTLRDGSRKGKPHYRPNTPEAIAQQIQERGSSTHRIYRSGSILTFVAINPGVQPGHYYDVSSTRLNMTASVPEQGAGETNNELATRIRNTPFPGWQASVGATANVVRFTAVVGGPKADASYNQGATTAAGTMATVTQGTIDTAEDLAARIRATAFPNWTVSGSGRTIRFTATTTGRRQPGAYSAGPTGATGGFETVRKGTSNTITAVAKNRDDSLDKKVLEANVGAATIFNTDITVSGAGTERGVVNFWFSIGAAPLELRARMEDVDLRDYPAGHVRLGILTESDPSLTWELHTDEVRITDKGRTFFHDHTASGKWIGQVHALYAAYQRPLQHLLLQEGKAAVLPGKTYTLSAWIRAIVPGTVPARPLVATTREAGETGLYHELGDVTNSPGLLGTSEWTEYRLTFTVPKNCYVVELSSKDVSGGEFVVQEVVLSPGTAPDRSETYATMGTYTSTFDLRTSDTLPHLHFWSTQRIALGAITAIPSAASTITAYYRSARPSAADPNVPGPWSAYSTDPTLVPEGEFVQAYYELTGPGTETVEIKAGSPNVEYTLKQKSDKRMSTLLREDRTELPGGTAFAKLPEWAPVPPSGRRWLPSGTLHDDPDLFPPVGIQPEAVLLVFTDAARYEIESKWKKKWTIESHGKHVLQVKFSAFPVFEQESITVTEDGKGIRHSIWSVKLAPSQITSVIGIPS